MFEHLFFFLGGGKKRKPMIKAHDTTPFVYVFMVSQVDVNVPTSTTSEQGERCTGPVCGGTTTTESKGLLSKHYRLFEGKTVYSPTGRLISTYDDGNNGYVESTCTASLINEVTLLTAAQCLYHPVFGWALKVRFYPKTLFWGFQAQLIIVPK